MSLESLIPEARAALTAYSDLTDEVPASKISFAYRRQGDTKPGIVVLLSSVDYVATYGAANEVTTYRIDYVCYTDTGAKAAQIHELIKLAALSANSTTYDIRLDDEMYFVDVDGVHRSTVSTLWEKNTGGTNGGSVNYITKSLTSRVDANVRYINTASHSVVDDDFVIVCNVSTTISLPTSDDYLNRIVHIINNDGQNATIEIEADAQGGIYVDGSSTVEMSGTSLTSLGFIMLKTQGSSRNWAPIWKA